MSKSAAFEQSLFEFKERLSSNLLFGFAATCLVALPISLLRWLSIGYQTVFLHHLLLTLVICFCYFTSKKQNYKFKLLIIILTLSSLVISGTFSFGLQTGAASFTAFSALLVGLGWGAKAAVVYAVGWFLFFLSMGYGFIHGHIEYNIPPNVYADSLGAWATMAVGTSIVAIFSLISAKQCYDYFSQLIDQIEEQKQEIEVLANTDSLTGYSCNRLSMPHLTQAIHNAAREQNKVAVLFIDLNNFKQVNDKYGHSEGDLVLKEISYRMRSVLREIDIPCRVGGDEFLFILPKIHSREEVTAIIERIENTWIKPIKLSNAELIVFGSIGVAVYPDDGENADELRMRSDFAMYKQKRSH